MIQFPFSFTMSNQFSNKLQSRFLHSCHPFPPIPCQGNKVKTKREIQIKTKQRNKSQLFQTEKHFAKYRGISISDIRRCSKVASEILLRHSRRSRFSSGCNPM